MLYINNQPIPLADAMLKYLIIPLAKNAVSFCHYDRPACDTQLIDFDTLKKAIVWAMKENLNIQFLYPDEPIPESYKDLIDSVDHISIISSTCEDKQLTENADVIVFDTWASINYYPFNKEKSYIIRTAKEDFADNARLLDTILPKLDRLVVLLTNPHEFSPEDFDRYERTLDTLIPAVVTEYKVGHYIHFNLLTDRIFLNEMNNCNAGHESITLAPDGQFYACPAFYLDGSKSLGNIDDGIAIKNPQLYRLDHAPICSICDAYQCRRCVWHNQKTTLEINTPSHEQCVIAHIERNASKKLLETIQKHVGPITQIEIKSVDYSDPLDSLINM